MLNVPVPVPMPMPVPVPVPVVVAMVGVGLRLGGLSGFPRGGQGHILTDVFIVWDRERAVPTFLFAVSELNGLFHVRETQDGVRQAEVVHEAATPVIDEEVIFASI